MVGCSCLTRVPLTSCEVLEGPSHSLDLSWVQEFGGGRIYGSFDFQDSYHCVDEGEIAHLGWCPVVTSPAVQSSNANYSGS